MEHHSAGTSAYDQRTTTFAKPGKGLWNCEFLKSGCTVTATCKTAQHFRKGLSGCREPSSPNPPPAAPMLSEGSGRKPRQGPDAGRAREARHLFEELQLCGILQELPHGSRAIVGHEGFLTEGDWLPLGTGEGERMVRGTEYEGSVLKLD